MKDMLVTIYLLLIVLPLAAVVCTLRSAYIMGLAMHDDLVKFARNPER